MTAYYNEIDPFAAAWLRELIKAGLIAPGEVDERSITKVQPDDLKGFTQCHFFAGIGAWSYALRNAGWSDDTPVWTGSCPCQSFSASGKRGGFSDQRHLWPAWFRLIRECRPDAIFGEQVASKDGLAWLDVVLSDLEGTGYTCGAADTCAAGVGAPHIRQRLYFVADANGEQEYATAARRLHPKSASRGATGLMADSAERGLPERDGIAGRVESRSEAHGLGEAGELGNAASTRLQAERCASEQSSGNADTAGATNGFWRDVIWIPCRDGKYRAIEPGSTPLAHGAANRVGRLRGYGNAICAPQAQAFIESYLETL